MSWRADQIYTIPTVELIEYLQEINTLSDGLFLVNDLEGIRSDWTREFMLSNKKNENSSLKHALPDSGLLAILPKMYLTGYDSDVSDFWVEYSSYKEDKWSFMESFSFEPYKTDLEFSLNQKRLLTFLEFLNKKFNVPLLYYYCEMWGGDIDKEHAIVFNDIIKSYAFDAENETDVEITSSGKNKLVSTVLQTAFQHLSLNLPTWFFALHESSFDWKRYHITK